ncbi:hypothetical protein DERF_010733 [Dermatophagoides farinae]|uniref:Uncharacterized protein n=1 Tax=Dermatophagoides farinae TaxID=6954 RepID=A0A922HQV5_DERFA|nr:hypothetical protein DERF_010733 [Dermatophagoides farinae]
MKKNHHENEEKSIHNNKQQAKLLQQKLRFYLSYTIAMCDEIRQQNWLDVLVFHRERLWQEIQQNDSSSSSSSSVVIYSSLEFYFLLINNYGTETNLNASKVGATKKIIGKKIVQQQ